MTTPFKTIPAATDLTHSGSCALQSTKNIAELHKSALAAVHAIDPAGHAFSCQTAHWH